MEEQRSSEDRDKLVEGEDFELHKKSIEAIDEARSGDPEARTEGDDDVEGHMRHTRAVSE